MPEPANSPDINPIENYGGIFQKSFHEKVPSIKDVIQ